MSDKIHTEVSALQLVDQRRAQFALEKVRQNLTAEFRSHVRSMPSMILRNGLGQASAFYLAKKERRAVFNVLSEWLCSPEQVYEGCDNLIDGVTTKDMYAYRVAEAEAMAMLIWLKKFAECFCPKESEKNSGSTAQISQG